MLGKKVIMDKNCKCPWKRECKMDDMEEKPKYGNRNHKPTTTIIQHWLKLK